jgi:hypothetical protein
MPPNSGYTTAGSYIKKIEPTASERQVQRRNETK